MPRPVENKKALRSQRKLRNKKEFLKGREKSVFSRKRQQQSQMVQSIMKNDQYEVTQEQYSLLGMY